MFRMGHVYARDNSPGVSSAESKRTARCRNLLYAQTGVEYCWSCRNRLRACAYPTEKEGRVRVPVHPTESLVAARWSLKNVATRDTIWPP